MKRPRRMPGPLSSAGMASDQLVMTSCVDSQWLLPETFVFELANTTFQETVLLVDTLMVLFEVERVTGDAALVKENGWTPAVPESASSSYRTVPVQFALSYRVN